MCENAVEMQQNSSAYKQKPAEWCENAFPDQPVKANFICKLKLPGSKGVVKRGGTELHGETPLPAATCAARIA